MVFARNHKVNMGREPWNKGLTNKTDIRVNNISNKRKSQKYSKELYPNYGMRNKKHSKKSKRKMSDTHKKIKFSKKWKQNIGKAMSIILVGRKLSEEHKQNVGTGTHKGYQKFRFTKEWEEWKQKIREARAKQILPIKDTSIELKIQNFLKLLSIEFFTHRYMNIEHGYQCDVFIPIMNLVIECDGNYWHSYPTGRDIDHVRTKELLDKGFKVLRLWEFEIREMDINGFKQKIMELK